MVMGMSRAHFSRKRASCCKCNVDLMNKEGFSWEADLNWEEKRTIMWSQRRGNYSRQRNILWRGVRVDPCEFLSWKSIYWSPYSVVFMSNGEKIRRIRTMISNVLHTFLAFLFLCLFFYSEDAMFYKLKP